MPEPHRLTPRDVLAEGEPRPRYSVCTMVTRPALYAQMLASFERAGFVPPVAEYLYVDNAATNRLDAFGAIRRFLLLARGDYVVLCHEDVVLRDDGVARLDAVIRDLDGRDPRWALLGNAGGEAPFRTVARITDPNGEQRSPGLPREVQALDENFIVLRRDCTPAVSGDLEGFHFYGTDLCRQAALRGYRAWVVDFHLEHLSTGTKDARFWEARERVVEKYRRALAGGWVQTPITTMYLSGSRLWSALLNHPRVIKWKRSVAKRLGVTDPPPPPRSA